MSGDAEVPSIPTIVPAGGDDRGGLAERMADPAYWRGDGEQRALAQRMADPAYWRGGNEASEVATLAQDGEQELPGGEEAAEHFTGHVPAAALRQISEVKNAVATAGTWAEFESSFDGLPDAVHRAIENDLMWDRPSFVTPASQEALNAFSRTTAGRELVAEWGSYGPEKLARAQNRLWRVADQLSDAEFEAARYWLDHLETGEAKAVLTMMARR